MTQSALRETVTAGRSPGPRPQTRDRQDRRDGGTLAVDRDRAILRRRRPAEGFVPVLELDQDDLLVRPVALQHLGRFVGGEQPALEPAEDVQEAAHVALVAGAASPEERR